MPVETIPLVGALTTRGAHLSSFSKDQVFSGGIFRVIANNLTKKLTAYFEKRPGLVALNTPSSGNNGYMVYHEADFHASNAFSVFNVSSTYTLYFSTTQYLQFTGAPTGIASVVFGGVTYVFFTDSNAVHFINAAAINTGATFTADVTDTSAVLTNVSSTTGLLVGQTLSGTGLNASARIQTIDSATQVTMTHAATATNSGVTITRGRTGKIIDAQFPTDPEGEVVEMDGFLFIGTASGRIYSSSINSITSWTSTGYVTSGIYAGACRTLKKIGNTIVYLGKNGIERFINAGHASGSPLGRAENAAIRLGVLIDTFPSVANVGDVIYFAGNENANSANIYRLSAQGLTRISTDEVSTLISGHLTADIVVDAFILAGSVYVYVAVGTLGSAPDAELLYSESTGMWTKPAFPYMLRIRSSEYNLNSGRAIYAVGMNGGTGKVYRSTIGDTATVYQDDGAAFSLTVTTRPLDFGTNLRKTVSRVDLIGSDIQSSGTATLETSDDDYATWVTRNPFDVTDINPRCLRVGSHKGARAYRITHSGNTAFRCAAIAVHYEIDEEQGT